MSRFRLGVVVIAAVAFAAVGGTVAARWASRHAQPAPPNPEQPALSIDPSHLNFGEVWETDQFELTAPVRNHTAAPIRAAAYASTCSCVSAGSTSLVPANDTAPLTFRIDLRQQCASAEPQTVRDVKIGVALGRDSSPTEKPIPVEIRGRVKSAIVVPARSIDFGRFPTTATTKPRVIPIRSLIGLRDLSATSDSALVLAELKPLAADKWELHVRPSATLIVGRHEAKVRLTPTTAVGEQVPPVTIPVAFDVLHDIQPDTSLVPLGAGRVGETLSGTLTIASLSNRPFALPTCEGMTVQPPQATSPQSSYTFRFEQTVKATGNQIVPVTIRGRDADGQPFERRVEVQWYGLAP